MRVYNQAFLNNQTYRKKELKNKKIKKIKKVGGVKIICVSRNKASRNLSNPALLLGASYSLSLSPPLSLSEPFRVLRAL
jgi:hypothetical protein